MILQFVILPAALWWAFMGLALWVTSRRGRVWVLRMSALGLGVLIALALQLLLNGATSNEAVVVLDRIILWITLPVAVLGQGLLTWWMLGKA